MWRFPQQVPRNQGARTNCQLGKVKRKQRPAWILGQKAQKGAEVTCHAILGPWAEREEEGPRQSARRMRAEEGNVAPGTCGVQWGDGANRTSTCPKT